MEIPTEDERLQEIRSIRKLYKEFYELLGGLTFVSIAILIGFVFFTGEADIGYKANVYTTLIGVLITIFVLDRRAAHREAKRLRAQLIREMGTRNNGIALRAVRELRAHTWLQDGSLRGADLFFADLQKADLSGANMSEVYLNAANLQESELFQTNLEKARLFETDLTDAKMLYSNLRNAKLEAAKLVRTDLTHADLSGSNLFRADLTEAHLGGAILVGAQMTFANLAGASLRGANLKGANLREANIEGVEIKETEFDENTTLPDGNKWTPNTNMALFVDQNTSKFWRSTKKRSPAYNGEDDEL